MSLARWIITIGNFKISETVVVSWLIIGFLTLVSFLLTRNLKKVPTSKVQIFLEFAVMSLVNWVTDTMGKNIVKKIPNMIPFMGSLMLFFICSNLVGLIGLRSPTIDIDTTLAWAIISLCMIYFTGVKLRGPKFFKTLLEPSPLMLPLNLIGEIAKPISLAFRPFGNILGGTVIMKLMYDALKSATPIAQLGVPIIPHLYFDIFAGVLQPFIFIMLTMIFVGSAVEE